LCSLLEIGDRHDKLVSQSRARRGTVLFVPGSFSNEKKAGQPGIPDA
jgi:hypothetical protein